METSIESYSENPRFKEKVDELIDKLFKELQAVEAEDQQEKLNVGVNALIQCIACVGRFMVIYEAATAKEFSIHIAKQLMMALSEPIEKPENT